MAEAKTKATAADVSAFLDAVPDPVRRADGKALAEMMGRLSGSPPVLWGTDIVGFGTYSYTYASGRTGDWPLIGFSPRARELSIYVFSGHEAEADLRTRLGKHRAGKACLYVRRLGDIDPAVLGEMIVNTLAHTRARYPTG